MEETRGSTFVNPCNNWSDHQTCCEAFRKFPFFQEGYPFDIESPQKLTLYEWDRLDQEFLDVFNSSKLIRYRYIINLLWVFMCFGYCCIRYIPPFCCVAFWINGLEKEREKDMSYLVMRVNKCILRPRGLILDVRTHNKREDIHNEFCEVEAVRNTITTWYEINTSPSSIEEKYAKNQEQDIINVKYWMTKEGLSKVQAEKRVKRIKVDEAELQKRWQDPPLREFGLGEAKSAKGSLELQLVDMYGLPKIEE